MFLLYRPRILGLKHGFVLFKWHQSVSYANLYKNKLVSEACCKEENITNWLCLCNNKASHWANGAKMKLYRRRCDVITSHQR